MFCKLDLPFRIKKSICCLFSLFFFFQCQHSRLDREPLLNNPVGIFYEKGKPVHFATKEDIAFGRNTPEEQKRDDPNCTGQNALNDMGWTSVKTDALNDFRTVPVNFSGVSGEGLQSHHSLGVVTGTHWRQDYFDCELLKDKIYTCVGSEVSVLEEGEDLPFCKKGPYPEHSIENAALAIMTGIQITEKFYEQSSGKSLAQKVRVYVFPKIERVLHLKDGSTFTVYDTDNARWSNSSWKKNSPFSIEFLPHSLEKRSYFKKSVWSQPGVASHELSHHIFYKIAPHMSSVGGGGTAGVHRRVDLSMTITALNEGFADLLAYYSYSSGVNPIGKFEFSSFKKARFVGAETNDDEAPKVISPSVLKHFFQDKRSFPDNTSISPDHQDVHTLGALSAFVMDQLFSLKIKFHHQTISTEKKAKLLYLWVEEIDKFFLDQELKQRFFEEPSFFLEKALYKAVQIAFIEPDKLALTQGQCEIIRKRLSAYASSWEEQKKYFCLSPEDK